MLKTLQEKRNSKKGFTLAELLIVVAIIAVLVAISIPIFTTQLEKSREATDAANLRAAYAEVMASALSQEADTANGVTMSGNEGSYVFTKEVTAKQRQAGWQNTSIAEIGGVPIANIGGSTTGWTVSYTQGGLASFTAK